MEIITNNQWRPFLYSSELTPKEAEDFDYMDDITESTFLRYRGVVYDVGEFMRTAKDDDLAAWDGYHGSSYFSGVLIKVSDCGDMYKIATYLN